jgi:Flp pilus assembly pilin Flp
MLPNGRIFLGSGPAHHRPMLELFASLLRDESGQDLIEYTLLMAFVALASAALFIGAGGSIQGIWSVSNSQLTAANSSAS